MMMNKMPKADAKTPRRSAAIVISLSVLNNHNTMIRFIIARQLSSA
jgi:hypothetical protein